MDEIRQKMYLRYLDEVSLIRSRTSSAYQAALSSAREYGSILVKSTIILNSGALLAIPLFLAGHERLRDSEPTIILISAMIFVIGIILGAVCGFVTYLNWSLHAQYLEECGSLEERQIRNNFRDYLNIDELNQVEIEKIESEISSISRNINKTLWASWISGWASCTAFISGCGVAGYAFLTT